MNFLTVSFDTKKHSATLTQLAAALKIDAPIAVANESRLFLKQLIKFTPPKSQAQGRVAVARDIRRAMVPLRPDSFGDDKGIVKMIRKNDIDGFNAFLKNTPNHKNWKAAEFDATWHKSARKSRGRVISQQKIFVLNKVAAWKRYVRKIQLRVGRMKSAWAETYVKLGGRVPAWINRHIGKASGWGKIELGGHFPKVTINNHAYGITYVRPLVQEAFRAREEAMRKRIRLVLSGYARDQKRQIMIQNKLRKDPDSMSVAA